MSDNHQKRFNVGGINYRAKFTWKCEEQRRSSNKEYCMIVKRETTIIAIINKENPFDRNFKSCYKPTQ